MDTSGWLVVLLFLFQVCGPRERKVEGGIHHRLPSPPLYLQPASLQAPALAAWLAGWLALSILPSVPERKSARTHPGHALWCHSGALLEDM